MVFLWRNQYVLLSYGTINSQSALVVRCLRCGALVRTHDKTASSMSTVHILVWFGLFAMCSYTLKPIPQRMDLRERKHASQSLSHEPIQHKSNLTIKFDNGNQW